MSEDFLNSSKMIHAIEAVESCLQDHFRGRAPEIEVTSPQLLESMRYSLFSGGKRFRPTLSLTVSSKAVAWAAAVEMIHTYSLIHDDLPCMDNDDERRGQPTNHKKFGEPLALLAGDALLTESFLLIAQAYAKTPEVAQRLTLLLAQSAGASGMVGGQAMDMGVGRTLDGIEDVYTIHYDKTAELIAAAIEGAAIVGGASHEVCGKLRELGLNLGLCFQIKDDLLDGDQDQSAKSFLFYLSVEQVQLLLEQKTTEGLEELEKMPLAYQNLRRFYDYNLTRNK